ncbi:acyl-CoA thioesterase [Ilyobacter polytropus]|uniref:Thioesterase superfamily protein n=1 Tax=Ilyobacter polytropus (strain ATCC 51220 / DSM 2926 / LMG 16218 / CuHBu1) TaxID=572544 RepID=E3H9X6_ILYPC|nr:thioesterase family protein [Ilyobacter polytropus]ADO83104.1 thioesterase superfamily protein [Ilyobacter polytropus DSM 2926]
MNSKLNQAATLHRVYYNETDQMGRVYHGNFVNWMEKGRTEWLRSKGISYKELENIGVFLPVKDIGIEYFLPVEYDDVVKISAVADCITKIKVEFNYVITDESGEKLYARGKSTNIFTGKDGKPKRIDNEFLSIIWEEK